MLPGEALLSAEIASPLSAAVAQLHRYSCAADDAF